ncbi:hypothetical protein VOLCADRAFT_95718 [Volvox carteri f. nagariensis]|uniref:Uncharacterized protein n=1 Tax=Volvox carteri f. nagariensis TaxID=3068 RepID=D8U872_VOLCA|nr:uncharacterized protein VOLCADRAFT_95718 [Volvox carteri f. nagariensis]EFJ44039.1 hypothetical protein VOLCADRAFT_95718 [Volvox carteri f. nagariensis]|eukprot:XP_002954840.1 hypothetical protein VOLCADRAFT_95718 [Volvox carteri f. nagariensis]
MMVAAISVMFAGFLRFNDLAHISLKHDLLTLHDTHIAIRLPRSKTDQEGKGQTVGVTGYQAAAATRFLSSWYSPQEEIAIQQLSGGGRKATTTTAGGGGGRLRARVREHHLIHSNMQTQVASFT